MNSSVLRSNWPLSNTLWRNLAFVYVRAFSVLANRVKPWSSSRVPLHQMTGNDVKCKHALFLWQDLFAGVCMRSCLVFFICILCLILTDNRICHTAQPFLVFSSSCLIHAVACSSAADRAGSVWL